MSWKSVKLFLRKIFFSITVRLTALYACTMFVTLLVISALLYYALIESFNAQRKTLMLQESVVTQNISLQSSSGLHRLHHEEKEILEDYRENLALVLIIGMLISIILGAWLAKKSLWPLKAMGKTVRQMSSDALHQRLDPQWWPQEMFELAGGLNEMLDRLEKSFKRLKQFSADLAHEIRTPINNLRGEAEVALKQARSFDEYQKILFSSLEEYDRLNALISGLLFLARTENPETKLKRKEISVREMLDSVCDYYSAMAEEKNIQLQFFGEAVAWVDPMFFRRILSNLLGNELKYSPPGGVVNITLRSNKSGCYIVITDTGEGIAPEHLPHLFDRFYRVDAARSQPQGGFGLGLPIVNSIMELHQGRIHIESKLSHGTTTTLYFPARHFSSITKLS